MRSPDYFSLHVVSHEYLDYRVLLQDYMRFLRSIVSDEKAAKRLSFIESELKGIENAKDDDKVRRHRKELFFNEVWDLLNDIAPEGCYFGTHPAEEALLGFWEDGTEHP